MLLLSLALASCASGDPAGVRKGGAEPVPDGGDSGGDTAPDLPEEMRGIWVTRWSYSSPAEVEAIMAEVAAGGFNAVFFQVRGNFDAFYDSSLEPWSDLLTGTLGADPGWDPLATAVEAGHVQGLQVHAYLNVFPLWRGEEAPPASTPEHAYNEHPDWVVADSSGTPMALNSSYVFASPGNPEVRARVAAVAADIADRYDVDGVHLDYLRYPGPDYSHDAVSEAAFAAEGGGLSWADWERAMVVDTVRQVYDSAPVPITAAVWGIYENAWGWSSVSQGNVDYYQDSRAFLAEGVADANVPMIYWPVTAKPGDRLDFRTLVADHVAHSSGRHVYAGFGNEVTWEEALACLEAARGEGADGVVLFDYSLFADRMDDFRAGPFAEPAVPPSMDWR